VLILSLESVFAVLAGMVLLGERLTPVGAIGCLLILGGAVAVEAAPAAAAHSLTVAPTLQRLHILSA
jgi:drug/metabolite transporter (DMT)-like permease